MGYAMSAPSAEELAWEVEQLREVIAELVIRVTALESAERREEYEHSKTRLRMDGYQPGFPDRMPDDAADEDRRGVESISCEFCGGTLRCEPWHREGQTPAYTRLAHCLTCNAVLEV